MYGGMPEKHNEALRHVLRIIEDMMQTMAHTGLEEQIEPLSSDGMSLDSDKVALITPFHVWLLTSWKGSHRWLH